MARRKGRAYEKARDAASAARARAAENVDWSPRHKVKSRAKAPDTRFWTAERRERLAKAVGQYNATVTRLDKIYRGAVELPNYVDLAIEYTRIGNAKQFNTRIKQIERILKKNAPDAQDIIEVSPGRYMLKYLKRELQYAQRKNNAWSSRLREELYPNWDDMSPVEKATARASSNIDEDMRDTSDMGGDDLDDMWSAEWDKAWEYFQRYLSVWDEYHASYEGYAEVSRIINDFYAYKPAALVTILEGPDPEKDISYIYPTGRELRAMGKQFRKTKSGRSVPVFGQMSPDLTPAELKRRNVLKFWQRKAADYGI